LSGLKDEFQISINTYSLKPGGGIYRSKCRRGGNRLSILESLDVECVVIIFHIDDWISPGLVLPWVPIASGIQG